MITYIVGEPFPKINFRTDIDLYISEPNTDFFDIHVYLKQPTEKEIKIFNSNPIMYGCYIQSYIPFFLIDFVQTGWKFDVSLNMIVKKPAEVEAVKEWVTKDSGRVFMFLIDSKTNILVAMRGIVIKKLIADNIREAIKNQTNFYKTAADFEKAFNSIIGITTAQMMKLVNMETLRKL